MPEHQPGVASVVVAFVARAQLAVYLTPHDRMEICRWGEAARASGYDRMVIHEHETGDNTDFGDFLCLHRRGEAWSRWGFARRGQDVNVWCCLTGADIGEFPSLAAAFQSILSRPSIRPDRLAARLAPRLAVVTELRPQLRGTARSLGSAA